MEKIIVEGVEVQFNDFSKEMQKKLYLQDREKFEKEAACSQFEEIRRLVIENEQSSSAILDEVFKVEVEQYFISENIRLLKCKTNFHMNNEKRKKLAESEKWYFRKMAAKDEGSSNELLNQMLRDEIERVENRDVIEAILANSNFKMEDESRKKLAESYNEKWRKIAAEDEGSSSEFLNKMLQDELEGKMAGSVIEKILNNPNFKMEEKSRNMLSKSECRVNRLIVAKDEESSNELLNQMLQDEIEGAEDSDVIKAILNNSNFKMKEENRIKLAKSNYGEYREMAAKDEGSSNEFLKQMLQNELEGKNDFYVVKAILDNPNLEESIEFLEKMYLKERDRDLIKVIERKLLQEQKNFSVNIIQKLQILKALRNLKTSNTSVLECLNKILEIIA